jgi:hypothetical protein
MSRRIALMGLGQIPRYRVGGTDARGAGEKGVAPGRGLSPAPPPGIGHDGGTAR